MQAAEDQRLARFRSATLRSGITRASLAAIAALLWRVVRIGARVLIRLIPASGETKQAIENLRADIRGLPPATTVCTEEWSRHESDLRHDILTKDPRAFLTWDVIAETMSPPPYARFVRPELQYLKSFHWRAWSRVIRGSWLARANSIHQVFHLCRFEAETSMAIREFDFILEFGGGYGEMRRIVHHLGFAGRYVIFDLPEQNALQRYYLSTIGHPPTGTASELKAVRAAIESEPPDSTKLFIATWSFDETPAELREEWTDVLSHFDAFLIAYQANFAGIDNAAFFFDWQKRFPRIRWSTRAIPYVKESFYLVGSASSG